MNTEKKSVPDPQGSWGKGSYYVNHGRQIEGYGDKCKPLDPHDFEPDPRFASQEEIENHRAACEAFDRKKDG